MERSVKGLEGAGEWHIVTELIPNLKDKTVLDLGFIFNDRIHLVRGLSPGYEDHASDVWLVKADRQEVVVRSSRLIGVPNNDFWLGCKRIFGIDPRQVHGLEKINNTFKIQSRFLS